MMSIARYKYGGKYKTDDIVILEADSHGQQRVCPKIFLGDAAFDSIEI